MPMAPTKEKDVRTLLRQMCVSTSEAMLVKLKFTYGKNMTAFFADEVAIFVSFGVNVVVLTVCTGVNFLRKGGAVC
jgi:hypothetical protein